MRDFEDEVRIAKLKLSGFSDRAVAEILPGAPRVAQEVAALLDDMLNVMQRDSAAWADRHPT